MLHATVPSARQLTEAVRGGLPNGTDNLIWTSSHEGYNGSQFLLGVMHWKGTNTSFDATYPNYASWDYNLSSYSRPFRCAGLRTKPTISSPQPADVFTDEASSLVAMARDTAAVTFMQAVNDCRSRGGHLPGQRDLARLVMAGLPGTNNVDWRWTSEVMFGSAGVGQYTGIVRWTGVDPFFDDSYPTYTTWGTRQGSSNHHRCVWYPLDPTTVPPETSTCNGGCFDSTVAAGAAKSEQWADNSDRAPASRALAISTCANLGGRLASHRDLAELIVAGLPNGSASWLWTSSHASYNTVHVVRWSGTDTAWSDAWGTQSSVLTDQSNTTAPYRCLWTNELID
jgi:hypothetical protein